MKKLNSHVSLVINILLSLAIVITPLSTLPVLAQAVSLWTGSDLPTASQIGPNQPIKWPQGVFCQDKTITVFKNALLPQEQVDVCTVSTGYGEVGDNFLKFSNTSQFVRMDSNNIGGVLNVPSIDAMYVTRLISGQRFMYAYDNPAAKIYLDQNTGGDWTSTYKTTSSTDWTLKDDNNQPILIREYAVSKNGRFMAIEVANGIIRFDTSTRQFFKFTATVPKYGTGANPILHMAISNDGKYVTVSGTNYGGDLDIYDLGTCIMPSQPNSISLASGCSNKRLTTFMQAAVPGFNGGFQLEFNGDATQLYMNTVEGRTVLQAPNTVPHQLSYLGLGDSFSSGEGAYAYLPGTDADGAPQDGIDTSKEKCHVSALSYPMLLGVASNLGSGDFNNIACSGTHGEHIYNPNDFGQFDQLASRDSNSPQKIQAVNNFIPGRAAQIEFVTKYKPSAITLTVGGNDVGFGDKIVDCIWPGTCSYVDNLQVRRGVFAEIQSQFSNLKGLYDKLHEASPNTRVYVLGYPDFIGNAAGPCSINTGAIDQAEREFIKQAVHYMNDVIEAAAKSAGVYFVDIEDSLAGKELCSDSDKKAVNGIMFGNDKWGIFGNESFHPNALGHSLIAQTILADLGNILTHSVCTDGSTVVCPDSSVTAAPPLPASVISATSPLYTPIITELSASVITKDQPIASFGLDLSNLKPGEAVTFELHSEPVVLGNAIVGQDGKLSTTLELPEGTPAGSHTLHAYTTNLAGEKVDLYQHITVLGPEGDRDEDGVEDAVDPCPFVQPANIDKDFDGVDDACDGEITEPIDTLPPVVAGTPDSAANEQGWHNSDVTINWSSTDPEPSSGMPTTPNQTIANLEGAHTYTSEESCDPAGNCAFGSLDIKLDKTQPTLGDAVWTSNPKSITGEATLSLAAGETISGIEEAEYYLGDVDPGQGNGATMAVSPDGTLSTVFGTDFPTGVYKVAVRAKDFAGNWSQDVSDYLVVHNTSGTRMTGKRTFVPSLFDANLPGLIASDQEDKVKFGFNVRYDRLGFIHPNSDLQLKYETGNHCKRSYEAVNCHRLELNATHVDWLATYDFNNSKGTFQGNGVLIIDGLPSNVTFMVTGLDGELAGPGNQDNLQVKIYPAGANPNFSVPAYHASGEVLRGNVRIRVN